MDKQEASITGKQDRPVFHHQHSDVLPAAAFVLGGELALLLKAASVDASRVVFTL